MGWETCLEEWATDIRRNLSPNVNRLIKCADYDLYFGPMPEGDQPDGDQFTYPGFDQACHAIRDALDDADIPSEVWVDIQSGEVHQHEPEAYTDPETGEVFEPDWTDIVHVGSKHITAAIVGDELANYL